MDFLHQDLPDSDIPLFFNAGDNPVRFDDTWTMAHIVHAVGIFPSVSQARKNGWNKPIEPGWSEFVIGKLKREIFILNKW